MGFLSREFVAREYDQIGLEKVRRFPFRATTKAAMRGHFVPEEHFYVLDSYKGFPEPDVKSKAKVTNEL